MATTSASTGATVESSEGETEILQSTSDASLTLRDSHEHFLDSAALASRSDRNLLYDEMARQVTDEVLQSSIAAMKQSIQHNGVAGSGGGEHGWLEASAGTLHPRSYVQTERVEIRNTTTRRRQRPVVSLNLAETVGEYDGQERASAVSLVQQTSAAPFHVEVEEEAVSSYSTEVGMFKVPGSMRRELGGISLGKADDSIRNEDGLDERPTAVGRDENENMLSEYGRVRLLGSETDGRFDSESTNQVEDAYRELAKRVADEVLRSSVKSLEQPPISYSGISDESSIDWLGASAVSHFRVYVQTDRLNSRIVTPHAVDDRSRGSRVADKRPISFTRSPRMKKRVVIQVDPVDVVYQTTLKVDLVDRLAERKVKSESLKVTPVESDAEQTIPRTSDSEISTTGHITVDGGSVITGGEILHDRVQDSQAQLSREQNDNASQETLQSATDFSQATTTWYTDGNIQLPTFYDQHDIDRVAAVKDSSTEQEEEKEDSSDNFKSSTEIFSKTSPDDFSTREISQLSTSSIQESDACGVLDDDDDDEEDDDGIERPGRAVRLLSIKMTEEFPTRETSQHSDSFIQESDGCGVLDDEEEDNGTERSDRSVRLLSLKMNLPERETPNLDFREDHFADAELPAYLTQTETHEDAGSLEGSRTQAIDSSEEFKPTTSRDAEILRDSEQRSTESQQTETMTKLSLVPVFDSSDFEELSRQQDTETHVQYPAHHAAAQQQIIAGHEIPGDDSKQEASGDSGNEDEDDDDDVYNAHHREVRLVSLKVTSMDDDEDQLINLPSRRGDPLNEFDVEEAGASKKKGKPADDLSYSLGAGDGQSPEEGREDMEGFWSESDEEDGYNEESEELVVTRKEGSSSEAVVTTPERKVQTVVVDIRNNRREDGTVGTTELAEEFADGAEALVIGSELTDNSATFPENVGAAEITAHSEAKIVLEAEGKVDQDTTFGSRTVTKDDDKTLFQLPIMFQTSVPGLLGSDDRKNEDAENDSQDEKRETSTLQESTVDERSSIQLPVFYPSKDAEAGEVEELHESSEEDEDGDRNERKVRLLSLKMTSQEDTDKDISELNEDENEEAEDTFQISDEDDENLETSGRSVRLLFLKITGDEADDQERSWPTAAAAVDAKAKDTFQVSDDSEEEASETPGRNVRLMSLKMTSLDNQIQQVSIPADSAAERKDEPFQSSDEDDEIPEAAGRSVRLLSLKMTSSLDDEDEGIAVAGPSEEAATERATSEHTVKTEIPLETHLEGSEAFATFDSDTGRQQDILRDRVQESQEHQFQDLHKSTSQDIPDESRPAYGDDFARQSHIENRFQLPKDEGEPEKDHEDEDDLAEVSKGRVRLVSMKLTSFEDEDKILTTPNLSEDNIEQFYDKTINKEQIERQSEIGQSQVQETDAFEIGAHPEESDDPNYSTDIGMHKFPTDRRKELAGIVGGELSAGSDEKEEETDKRIAKDESQEHREELYKTSEGEVSDKKSVETNRPADEHGSFQLPAFYPSKEAQVEREEKTEEKTLQDSSEEDEDGEKGEGRVRLLSLKKVTSLEDMDQDNFEPKQDDAEVKETFQFSDEENEDFEAPDRSVRLMSLKMTSLEDFEQEINVSRPSEAVTSELTTSVPIIEAGIAQEEQVESAQDISRIQETATFYINPESRETEDPNYSMDIGMYKFPSDKRKELAGVFGRKSSDSSDEKVEATDQGIVLEEPKKDEAEVKETFQFSDEEDENFEAPDRSVRLMSLKMTSLEYFQQDITIARPSEAVTSELITSVPIIKANISQEEQIESGPEIFQVQETATFDIDTQSREADDPNYSTNIGMYKFSSDKRKELAGIVGRKSSDSSDEKEDDIKDRIVKEDSPGSREALHDKTSDLPMETAIVNFPESQITPGFGKELSSPSEDSETKDKGALDTVEFNDEYELKQQKEDKITLTELPTMFQTGDQVSDDRNEQRELSPWEKLEVTATHEVSDSALEKSVETNRPADEHSSFQLPVFYPSKKADAEEEEKALRESSEEEEDDEKGDGRVRLLSLKKVTSLEDMDNSITEQKEDEVKETFQFSDEEDEDFEAPDRSVRLMSLKMISLEDFEQEINVSKPSEAVTSELTTSVPIIEAGIAQEEQVESAQDISRIQETATFYINSESRETEDPNYSMDIGMYKFPTDKRKELAEIFGRSLSDSSDEKVEATEQETAKEEPKKDDAEVKETFQFSDEEDEDFEAPDRSVRLMSLKMTSLEDFEQDITIARSSEAVTSELTTSVPTIEADIAQEQQVESPPEIFQVQETETFDIDSQSREADDPNYSIDVGMYKFPSDKKKELAGIFGRNLSDSSDEKEDDTKDRIVKEESHVSREALHDKTSDLPMETVSVNLTESQITPEFGKELSSPSEDSETKEKGAVNAVEFNDEYELKQQKEDKITLSELPTMFQTGGQVSGDINEQRELSPWEKLEVAVSHEVSDSALEKSVETNRPANEHSSFQLPVFYPSKEAQVEKEETALQESSGEEEEEEKGEGRVRLLSLKKVTSLEDMDNGITEQKEDEVKETFQFSDEEDEDFEAPDRSVRLMSLKMTSLEDFEQDITIARPFEAATSELTISVPIIKAQEEQVENAPEISQNQETTTFDIDTESRETHDPNYSIDIGMYKFPSDKRKELAGISGRKSSDSSDEKVDQGIAKEEPKEDEAEVKETFQFSDEEDEDFEAPDRSVRLMSLKMTSLEDFEQDITIARPSEAVTSELITSVPIIKANILQEEQVESPPEIFQVQETATFDIDTQPIETDDLNYSTNIGMYKFPSDKRKELAGIVGRKSSGSSDEKEDSKEEQIVKEESHGSREALHDAPADVGNKPIETKVSVDEHDPIQLPVFYPSKDAQVEEKERTVQEPSADDEVGDADERNVIHPSQKVTSLEDAGQEISAQDAVSEKLSDAIQTTVSISRASAMSKGYSLDSALLTREAAEEFPRQRSLQDIPTVEVTLASDEEPGSEDENDFYEDADSRDITYYSAKTDQTIEDDLSETTIIEGEEKVTAEGISWGEEENQDWEIFDRESETEELKAREEQQERERKSLLQGEENGDWTLIDKDYVTEGLTVKDLLQDDKPIESALQEEDKWQFSDQDKEDFSFQDEKQQFIEEEKISYEEEEKPVEADYSEEKPAWISEPFEKQLFDDDEERTEALDADDKPIWDLPEQQRHLSYQESLEVALDEEEVDENEPVWKPFEKCAESSESEEEDVAIEWELSEADIKSLDTPILSVPELAAGEPKDGAFWRSSSEDVTMSEKEGTPSQETASTSKRESEVFAATSYLESSTAYGLASAPEEQEDRHDISLDRTDDKLSPTQIPQPLATKIDDHEEQKKSETELVTTEIDQKSSHIGGEDVERNTEKEIQKKHRKNLIWSPALLDENEAEPEEEEEKEGEPDPKTKSPSINILYQSPTEESVFLAQAELGSPKTAEEDKFFLKVDDELLEKFSPAYSEDEDERREWPKLPRRHRDRTDERKRYDDEKPEEQFQLEQERTDDVIDRELDTEVLRTSDREPTTETEKGEVSVHQVGEIELESVRRQTKDTVGVTIKRKAEEFEDDFLFGSPPRKMLELQDRDFPEDVEIDDGFTRPDIDDESIHQEKDSVSPRSTETYLQQEQESKFITVQEKEQPIELENVIETEIKDLEDRVEIRELPLTFQKKTVSNDDQKQDWELHQWEKTDVAKPKSPFEASVESPDRTRRQGESDVIKFRVLYPPQISREKEAGKDKFTTDAEKTEKTPKLSNDDSSSNVSSAKQQTTEVKDNIKQSDFKLGIKTSETEPEIGKDDSKADITSEKTPYDFQFKIDASEFEPELGDDDLKTEVASEVVNEDVSDITSEKTRYDFQFRMDPSEIELELGEDDLKTEVASEVEKDDLKSDNESEKTRYDFQYRIDASEFEPDVDDDDLKTQDTSEVGKEDYESDITAEKTRYDFQFRMDPSEIELELGEDDLKIEVASEVEKDDLKSDNVGLSEKTPYDFQFKIDASEFDPELGENDLKTQDTSEVGKEDYESDITAEKTRYDFQFRMDPSEIELELGEDDLKTEVASEFEKDDLKSDNESEKTRYDFQYRIDASEFEPDVDDDDLKTQDTSEVGKEDYESDITAEKTRYDFQFRMDPSEIELELGEDDLKTEVASEFEKDDLKSENVSEKKRYDFQYRIDASEFEPDLDDDDLKSQVTSEVGKEDYESDITAEKTRYDFQFRMDSSEIELELGDDDLKTEVASEVEKDDLKSDNVSEKTPYDFQFKIDASEFEPELGDDDLKTETASEVVNEDVSDITSEKTRYDFQFRMDPSEIELELGEDDLKTEVASEFEKDDLKSDNVSEKTRYDFQFKIDASEFKPELGENDLKTEAASEVVNDDLKSDNASEKKRYDFRYRIEASEFEPEFGEDDLKAEVMSEKLTSIETGDFGFGVKLSEDETEFGGEDFKAVATSEKLPTTEFRDFGFTVKTSQVETEFGDEDLKAVTTSERLQTTEFGEFGFTVKLSEDEPEFANVTERDSEGAADESVTKSGIELPSVFGASIVDRKQESELSQWEKSEVGTSEEIPIETGIESLATERPQDERDIIVLPVLLPSKNADLKETCADASANETSDKRDTLHDAPEISQEHLHTSTSSKTSPTTESQDFAFKVQQSEDIDEFADVDFTTGVALAQVPTEEVHDFAIEGNVSEKLSTTEFGDFGFSVKTSEDEPEFGDEDLKPVATSEKLPTTEFGEIGFKVKVYEGEPDYSDEDLKPVATSEKLPSTEFGDFGLKVKVSEGEPDYSDEDLKCVATSEKLPSTEFGDFGFAVKTSEDEPEFDDEDLKPVATSERLTTTEFGDFGFKVKVSEGEPDYSDEDLKPVATSEKLPTTEFGDFGFKVKLSESEPDFSDEDLKAVATSEMLPTTEFGDFGFKVKVSEGEPDYSDEDLKPVATPEKVPTTEFGDFGFAVKTSEDEPEFASVTENDSAGSANESVTKFGIELPSVFGASIVDRKQESELSQWEKSEVGTSEEIPIETGIESLATERPQDERDIVVLPVLFPSKNADLKETVREESANEANDKEDLSFKVQRPEDINEIAKVDFTTGVPLAQVPTKEVHDFAIEGKVSEKLSTTEFGDFGFRVTTSEDEPEFGDEDFKAVATSEKLSTTEFGDFGFRVTTSEDEPEFGDEDFNPKVKSEKLPIKAFGDFGFTVKTSEDEPKFGDEDFQAVTTSEKVPTTEFGDFGFTVKTSEDEPELGNEDFKAVATPEKVPTTEFGDFGFTVKTSEDEPELGNEDFKAVATPEKVPTTEFGDFVFAVKTSEDEPEIGDEDFKAVATPEKVPTTEFGDFGFTVKTSEDEPEFGDEDDFISVATSEKVPTTEFGDFGFTVKTSEDEPEFGDEDFKAVATPEKVPTTEFGDFGFIVKTSEDEPEFGDEVFKAVATPEKVPTTEFGDFGFTVKTSEDEPEFGDEDDFISVATSEKVPTTEFGDFGFTVKTSEDEPELGNEDFKAVATPEKVPTTEFGDFGFTVKTSEDEPEFGDEDDFISVATSEKVPTTEFGDFGFAVKTSEDLPEFASVTEKDCAGSKSEFELPSLFGASSLDRKQESELSQWEKSEIGTFEEIPIEAGSDSFNTKRPQDERDIFPLPVLFPSKNSDLKETYADESAKETDGKKRDILHDRVEISEGHLHTSTSSKTSPTTEAQDVAFKVQRPEDIDEFADVDFTTGVALAQVPTREAHDFAVEGNISEKLSESSSSEDITTTFTADKVKGTENQGFDSRDLGTIVAPDSHGSVSAVETRKSAWAVSVGKELTLEDEPFESARSTGIPVEEQLSKVPEKGETKTGSKRDPESGWSDFVSGNDTRSMETGTLSPELTLSQSSDDNLTQDYSRITSAQTFSFEDGKPDSTERNFRGEFDRSAVAGLTGGSAPAEEREHSNITASEKRVEVELSPLGSMEQELYETPVGSPTLQAAAAESSNEDGIEIAEDALISQHLHQSPPVVVLAVGRNPEPEPLGELSTEPTEEEILKDLSSIQTAVVVKEPPPTLHHTSLPPSTQHAVPVQPQDEAVSSQDHTSCRGSALNVITVATREIGPNEIEKRQQKENQLSQEGSRRRPPAAPRSAEAIALSAKAQSIKASSEFLRKDSRPVGAVGFVVVSNDVSIPPNDFFTPGRVFEARIKHSCFPASSDDRRANFKTMSIKLGDHDTESPFDLVLQTGQISPYCSAETMDQFQTALRTGKAQNIRQAIITTPACAEAVLDGLRVLPESYYDQHYYSPVIYHFRSTEGNRKYLARFRVIPKDGTKETGRLLPEQHADSWTLLSPDYVPQTSKPIDYLRNEYKRRFEGTDTTSNETPEYDIQIQLHEIPHGDTDKTNKWYNPFFVWNEPYHPWFSLATLTTSDLLPGRSTKSTQFTVARLPSKTFSFPASSSTQDFNSVPEMLAVAATGDQVMGVSATATAAHGVSAKQAEYYLYCVTGDRMSAGTLGDVYVSIVGTTGRTDYHKLEPRYKTDFERAGKATFVILDRPIGYLRYMKFFKDKHTTTTSSDWYLDYVILSTPYNNKSYTLPVYRWLTDEVNLLSVRDGPGILLGLEGRDDMKVQRTLEVSFRQQQLKWRIIHGQNPYSMLPGYLQNGEQLSTIPGDLQSDAVGPLEIQWREHRAGKFSLFKTIMKFFTSRKATISVEFEKTLADTIADKYENSKVMVHILRNWREDTEFARQLINGCSPFRIQRLDVIPANFRVTNEMVQDRLGPGRTLEGEMQDGRIFLISFPDLLEPAIICLAEADASRSNQRRPKGKLPPRFICAPMVLLYSTRGDQPAIIPLAIQLNEAQTPVGGEPLIFTKRDDIGTYSDWMVAKMWVRVAATNALIIGANISMRLMMEPVALALLRNLPAVHPVHKLLIQHLKDIVAINAVYRQHVLPMDGALAEVLAITKGVHLQYLAKIISETKILSSFDAEATFRRLKLLTDDDILPGYWLRDDLLRHWSAIKDFVAEIIAVYYKSDSDVSSDTELRSFIEDLRQDGGLPLVTSPETIDELVQFVAAVIFMCTSHQAATSRGLLDTFAYCPNSPPCMMKPPPTTRHPKGYTEQEMKDMLPNPDHVERFIGFVMLLFGGYKPAEVPLGSYPDRYFTEAPCLVAIDNFRRRLRQVSEDIRLRNANIDCPFEYILPNKVHQWFTV